MQFYLFEVFSCHLITWSRQSFLSFFLKCAHNYSASPIFAALAWHPSQIYLRQTNRVDMSVRVEVVEGMGRVLVACRSFEPCEVVPGLDLLGGWPRASGVKNQLGIGIGMSNIKLFGSQLTDDDCSKNSQTKEGMTFLKIPASAISFSGSISRLGSPFCWRVQYPLLHIGN